MQEAEWGAELVWKPWKREKCLDPFLDSNPDASVVQPITGKAELVSLQKQSVPWYCWALRGQDVKLTTHLQNQLIFTYILRHAFGSTLLLQGSAMCKPGNVASACVSGQVSNCGSYQRGNRK
jgi:hypothetical protein